MLRRETGRIEAHIFAPHMQRRGRTRGLCYRGVSGPWVLERETPRDWDYHLIASIKPGLHIMEFPYAVRSGACYCQKKVVVAKHVLANSANTFGTRCVSMRDSRVEASAGHMK